jgi:hypothetical protein
MGTIMMKYGLVMLMLGLYAPTAFSWGSVGHQTVGEIAERYLTPKTKEAITNILGPEKLAVTALWADNIKDDQDFDGFKEYHYVDVPNHTTYDKIPVNERAVKDAMTVITRYPDMLMNPNTERSVKMIALRYIVHVVGDVHQPLHVGNSTDNGGNVCKVLWDKGTLFNLHQIWDGKIIDFDISKLKVGKSPLKDYSYVSYADDILKNHPVTAADIAKTQADGPAVWLQESIDLRSQVYPDTTPVSDDAKRNYCNKTTNSFPKISDDYKVKAAVITEIRLLQGGLRLAAMLNKIFADGNNPGKNVQLTKEQIIEKVLLTNY